VTHSQCDATPTVTFLAAGHHRSLTGTKLYCLVTEARVCEQLAQGLLPDSCKEMTSNLKVGSRNRDLGSRKSNALAARPAGDTQSSWVAADRLRESRLTAVEFVCPVSACIVSITDVRRVNTAISVGAPHHVRPVARYTHGTTMQTTVLRPDLQNSSRFIIRLS